METLDLSQFNFYDKFSWLEDYLGVDTALSAVAEMLPMKTEDWYSLAKSYEIDIDILSSVKGPELGARLLPILTEMSGGLDVLDDLVSLFGVDRLEQTVRELIRNYGLDKVENVG